MAEWIHTFYILIFISQITKTELLRTFTSNTELNHLTVDTNLGHVYIGAMDHLFQLCDNLTLVFNVTTGPKPDDKKCTPPIDLQECHAAVPTHNYNKLLLLDVPKQRIVACGSIYKGICSLRKLGNISEETFYDENKGEKSFVTSNDEKVETVGLISDMREGGPRALYVGKGASQDDNGIIISTRILDDLNGKGPFETYQDSASLKYSYSTANTQQFTAVFEDSDRVYFISSLFDRSLHKNRALITRLCKDDPYYFSYVEMDLVCRGEQGNPYNICTSAFLAQPGKELAAAKGLSSDDKVLFAIFSTTVTNEKSALCMFSLKAINNKFEQNRDECYNRQSDSSNQDKDNVFSKPSGEKITCVKKENSGTNQNESSKYPCGSEHLPYPLQSRNGVIEDAILMHDINPFSSVAVSVENDHTVAFLGTAEGNLLKVHLRENATEYRTVQFDTTSTVKNGMVFDGSQEHLYVMTKKKVYRVPVQDCNRYSDCNECIQASDPYCGWCVIEGSCSRKADCKRADDPNHWLWSPANVCMKVESAIPMNMSVKESGNVMLKIVPSITLKEEDKLMCKFGGNVQYATLEEDGSISCPHPGTIPPNKPGKDYVDVPIQLFFTKNGTVPFANYSYQFYDCGASMYLSANLPCTSCVTTQWKCRWDISKHKCVDSSDDPVLVSQDANCPQFYDPEPAFIPMETKTIITFSGMNLENFQDESFIAGNDNSSSRLRFRETVIKQNDNKFSLSLRAFSVQDTENVPLDIYVKVNDKKVDSKLNVFSCMAYFLLITFRVVCRVQECAHCAGHSKKVEIWIRGKHGESPGSLDFTYQDPQPASVIPAEGVLAGGTRITVTGENLETGSESDVRVTLNELDCEVVTFGAEIVCITSAARKEGDVKVELHYGSYTVKEAGKFSYRSNPSISQFYPELSFASGGRNITISGTGFNLVQKFSMMAKVRSRREKRQVDGDSAQLIQKEDILEKVNDTVIIFSSPQISEHHLNSEVIAVIKMDGYETRLQTADLSFKYILDPTFVNFTDGIKKQVNNLINAKGNNLNAAMTIQEAKAFVGDGICKINTLTATDLYCVPPEEQPQPRRRHKRDTTDNLPEFTVLFGNREWVLGKVQYGQSQAIPLNIIIPVVLIPMILIIGISIYFYRRKSQQAEREYEKIRQQLEGLEESVRERCKKEFTAIMIEMEDQTSDLNEAGIPILDYKSYTDRVFFWSSKDGEKDVMITGKLDIPEARRQTVEQALNQFSNLLNSKSFLTIFIHTLEAQKDFSAREKLYFASLLTVALHGKLEYYTDIMRALFVELMDQYVAKNPKLMLRRSETVVERMLSNWMSICLYQFLKDTAGEHLYKLFRAIKHQVEKGPVDAIQAKAKYTLNDTGLLGDDVEYTQLTLNVIVQEEGGEPVPVKVLNCDTITQVKEKIVEQVYKNLPYTQRPKADSLAIEWRPGSTAQILSDLDLTSQKEGRWRQINTLMHYNVRDNATLILSRIGISQQQEENHQDFPGERHGLLEDENKVWHLVRPLDEVDEGKSKRGSMKAKEQTKAITEIYLTRLLSVKGTLQQFVDNFFQSVLNSNQVVPPAVKYFFDFLDEQAEKYEIKDEDTVHIWKTNSLSLRFWVNILKNPHFIFDVHVHQVVDASLSVIAQTFMDACSRAEHKLSRESPSNKLLYAKEISTYKKMVEDYYKGIRQMVQVSDQDMNTHLAEISRAHTESLNTMAALHQLYQYTKKYYDEIINALEEDPGAQRMQLAIRLQQIAAALENKVTDL
ncbi:plexin-B2 [Hyperolius riggenbachi]|uniref:plexin-B2 n=1 Tax=Hyperolius riggenbachi TaxID=752182 RepID=UPI0035A39AAD